MKIATITKCNNGFLVAADASLKDTWVYSNFCDASAKLEEIMRGPDTDDEKPYMDDTLKEILNNVRYKE
jgi:hypothetical protein